MNQFQDKTILITGGTGTIGSELVRQLLEFSPRQVRVFSRDDTKQHHLLESLGYPKNLRLFIGDVRDSARLTFALKGADIVFHAAALKHVPIGEYNPFEMMKTNVIGSQGVIEAALAAGVERVVAISTDKAVIPTSVMGVTKLMMEKLVINANYYKGDSPTKFSCVRFGNVAWARGSVLPAWKAQAARTGAIRLTNPEMTRFFMSLEQAVGLVLRAGTLAHGGEIFIFKMPSIKMADLANLFIAKYFKDAGVKVEVVGNRGGEKLHEELVSAEERYHQVLENGEMMILIPDLGQYGLGQLAGTYPGFNILERIAPYSSSDHTNIELVRQLI